MQVIQYQYLHGTIRLPGMGHQHHGQGVGKTGAALQGTFQRLWHVKGHGEQRQEAGGRVILRRQRDPAQFLVTGIAVAQGAEHGMGFAVATGRLDKYGMTG